MGNYNIKKYINMAGKKKAQKKNKDNNNEEGEEMKTDDINKTLKYRIDATQVQIVLEKEKAEKASNNIEKMRERIRELDDLFNEENKEKAEYASEMAKQ